MLVDDPGGDMGDNDQRNWAWAAASGWVTAFGVIFAGSQLFIMAMSTSLDSVERWPHMAITYVSKNTKYIQLVVANDGTGPAVIKDVRWKIANRPFRRWNDAAVALTGSSDDIFSHSRLADQVIPANSGNYTVLNLKQTPGGAHIQQA
jgi:hypothetical protein